jgi:hypothetical protein
MDEALERWNVYTSPISGLQMFVRLEDDLRSSEVVRWMTATYWGRPVYRINVRRSNQGKKS